MHADSFNNTEFVRRSLTGLATRSAVSNESKNTSLPVESNF